jgi:DNA-binding IclR family transcriptional regulator
MGEGTVSDNRIAAQRLQGRKGASVARKVAKKKAEETSTAVPAAARTLAVFEIFARERRPLSKSELARLLDLPESSCSDLLNTVHALGYVTRTVTTRRYYPTSRLLATATSIAESDPLGLLAAEAVSKLSNRTGETCTFGVIDTDAVKILAIMQGHYPLRYVAQAGDRVSLHATAIGKALLSELPPEEMARILRLKPLRRRTEHTLVDPKELVRRVQEERPQGWYSAVNEANEGVSSMAIGGRLGNEIAGMSIVGPTARLMESKDKYAAILKEFKSELF